MTKSDRLYGELKNRIIGCEPGSAFYSFRTIMNDYSVSQATVTAATRRLIDEGLLKPNTGKEMEITDEVLKYRQDAPPVVCLAMPHWQSDWYTFIEHHFFDLASELGYQLEVLRYDWRVGDPESLPQTKIDALVLVADSQRAGWTTANYRQCHYLDRNGEVDKYQDMAYGGAPKSIILRHAKRANIVFADNSVRSLGQPEVGMYGVRWTIPGFTN